MAGLNGILLDGWEKILNKGQGKAHIAKGIEDITNMTLTFVNGAIALIQSSWFDTNKVREITFIGKKREENKDLT